jgi:hypothetical protein
MVSGYQTPIDQIHSKYSIHMQRFGFPMLPIVRSISLNTLVHLFRVDWTRSQEDEFVSEHFELRKFGALLFQHHSHARARAIVQMLGALAQS